MAKNAGTVPAFLGERNGDRPRTFSQSAGIKNAGTVPAFLGRVFGLGPAKFKLTMVALGYLVKRLHDETLGCVSFLGGWLLAGSWVDLIHRDLVVA